MQGVFLPALQSDSEFWQYLVMIRQSKDLAPEVTQRNVREAVWLWMQDKYSFADPAAARASVMSTHIFAPVESALAAAGEQEAVEPVKEEAEPANAAEEGAEPTPAPEPARPRETTTKPLTSLEVVNLASVRSKAKFKEDGMPKSSVWFKVQAGSRQIPVWVPLRGGDDVSQVNHAPAIARAIRQALAKASIRVTDAAIEAAAQAVADQLESGHSM